MKTFKVLLTRSYIISVNAKNKKDAKLFSEYYIGGGKDLSNDDEKRSKKFKINDIEMTINEAFEAEEVRNEQ